MRPTISRTGAHHGRLEEPPFHTVPEVRLKTYLEMRALMVVPGGGCAPLPALWVGLLYDETSLDGAKELVRTWTEEERQALRDAVPGDRVGHTVPQPDGARHSQGRGLAWRGMVCADGRSPATVQPTKPATSGPWKKRSHWAAVPAETLLRQYETRWGQSVEPLFRNTCTEDLGQPLSALLRRPLTAKRACQARPFV
jgi:glutamate--cysteine ligase